MEIRPDRCRPTAERSRISESPERSAGRPGRSCFTHTGPHGSCGSRSGSGTGPIPGEAHAELSALEDHPNPNPKSALGRCFGSAGEDPASDPAEPEGPVLKEEIRALSVNGTLIFPEPGPHVAPVLRRPPNPLGSPSVAVPLLSSRYGPELDRSAALIRSFSRFPYPTQAELTRLTAALRRPERLLRAWFCTQRLKQGISWAPEEVEEARKKMFDGSVPEGPRTAALGSGPARTAQSPPSPGAPLSTAPETPRTDPSAASDRGTLGAPLGSEEQGPVPPERLPLSPIVSTNHRRSRIHQKTKTHTSTSSSAPKDTLSCVANGLLLCAAGSSFPAPLRPPQHSAPPKLWALDQADVAPLDSENSCAAGAQEPLELWESQPWALLHPGPADSRSRPRAERWLQENSAT